ncbi:DNRLRE domain-containing protein, partial [Agriterribacter sp.]|uniref:DNRLRE domain-containing protein n=1 Tax=Agriterribacter sp. TaxID=2821509 RepID=UPI002C0CB07D
MNYLSGKKLQKKVAALLLLVMFIETLLPAHTLAMVNWNQHYTSEGYAYKALPYPFSPLFNLTYDSVSKMVRHEESNTAVEPAVVKNMPQQKAVLKKSMIGGPGQPEMSSFKSVNADNMVDLFTGDFSYNIPLLDVGGYPVNIHYNGGATIDQEASWVGLGWNINPGTINRSMRGLPDDFNGEDKISRIQHIKTNKTVGVGVAGGFELFGSVLGLNFNVGVFNNTYNGWGTENGINANLSAGSASKGTLTASLGLQNNSQSGLNISPGLSYSLASQNSGLQGTASIGANYNSRMGLTGLQFNAAVSASTSVGWREKNDKNEILTRYENASLGTTSVFSSGISFATPAYTPSIQMPLTSTNYTFSAKYGGEIYGAYINASISGYVSKQEIAWEDTLQSLPGYGYLYYSKANDHAEALLDFNREKESYFNYKSTPHIALPQYNYDVYNISGEGTGGMFRPYRSEAGYIRDHHLQTKSKTDNLAFNIGGGTYFKGGVDFNETIATTRNAAWKSEITSNISFTDADSTYQPVYFRNPGEKTSNTPAYYNKIGGDSLVRIKLGGDIRDVTAANALVAYSNKRPVKNISVTGPLLKAERDKRTQVITYKNAHEAKAYGLDRIIRSYKENAIPIGACADTIVDTIPRMDPEVRKAHHLSEVTVLNADGRRYIYGLPAYNAAQWDVTFSVEKETNTENIDKGLAAYAADSDNTAKLNNKGKENFFTKDILPPYAHSFLLTGLVSPDYVDITEDGITDDDLGDAVKFNYSMIYGKGKGYYKWRTPNDQNKVNYSEGLKTYSRDDKGTYMYGEKEVWYLNSIVSKTMIAAFTITAQREDNLGVLNENGGIDAGRKLRRLERIDLYSRADLVKYGESARPVKSVHFEYDYSLCRNAPNNSGNPVDKNGNAVSESSNANVNKNKGKLTLRKIWFSYNGNYKGIKNPYTFSYGTDHSGQEQNKYNPQHNSKNYDMWGSYKDPAFNPGGLNNIEYPYAVQNRDKAAEYASAWNLTDIRLPSGGLMKVTYEADDYAYVQNRRAMQLFSIAGFGSSESDEPKPLTYQKIGEDMHDYDYVFIDVSQPVIDKADIYRKYLEGVKKLYCKIAVNMPNDRWGSGAEAVPCYIEADNNQYGVVSGNNHRIWIKMARVDSKHPVALAAIQFMRLNLTAKAYPTSEMGDNINLGDAVTMLASSLNEIRNTVKGFYDNSRTKNWGSTIELSRSFIRLNTPSHIKYGGGYRVKRVEVFDNWKQMTNQREASYGQDYSYTTSKIIARDTIVSGVRKLIKDTLVISSGVASYEPFIGGEENPFREPMEYEERASVLAPKNFMYTEKPLGESFYPSAMVGYSKVRVRTIHTKARSANGWQETEFYTTKEFPTLVDFTPLDGDSKKRYNPTLRNLLKLNAVQNITLSQGFKIELNDMNGKMKAQSNYSENDSANAIQYTRHFYKVDNEAVEQKHLNNKVWVVDSLNGKINTSGIIGLDIELMNDMREQYSFTHSKNHQANLDLIPFIWFPLPVITYFPMFQKEENTFRSAATVKIVQRYGILDSMVVIDKGSIVSTKNLVFDSETGDVVVSRTNNEFNDPVYQFNYPAYWAYSGMGPAYKNIDAVFKNKKVIKGRMLNANDTPFEAERFFESGDEILLESCSLIETVTPRTGDCPLYSFSGKTTGFRIWAIDAAKGKENDKGLYFIDENGKPFHGFIESMRILRSGKRNMLSAGAGSIVSLGNPVKEWTTGKYRIVIDSNANIIQTASTTYKDLWQVEKSYYVKDSVVRVYRDFEPLIINPRVSLMMYDVTGGLTLRGKEFYSNSKYVAASLDFMEKSTCRPSRSIYTKSILQFDLDQIPTDAIITSANISFIERIPKNFLPRVTEKKDCPLSSNRQSYDWQAATTFYKNASAAWIKKITTPFNSNTSYTNIKGNNVTKVAVDYNNYGSVDCAGLIQDYISDDIENRNGFVFELQKESRSNVNISETNYLSFCATNEDGVHVLPCGHYPYPSCNCSKPTLTVYYRAYVDSTIRLCKENISDTATNPYRWGILGNWRANRAYTWYHDRRESDAAITDTDIRTEGVLKDFTPFWSFTPTGVINSADTTKWVWNAASSIYNKRGFEIENYDPLGRYNAGLYGYNQSLPVAVAQNSRYRELLYDGFEDYNFKNEACQPLCENDREFDFVKDQSGVTIDSTQSHTGRYSVKVNAGSESLLTAVVSAADTIWPAVSAQVDSVPVYTTRVIGAGTGLIGKYDQSSDQSDDAGCYSSGVSSYLRNETSLDLNWGIATPVPNLCGQGAYSLLITGKIQARTTDNYRFYLNAKGGICFLVIGNSSFIFSNEIEETITVPLIEGQLYPVFIHYLHSPYNSSRLKLEWSATASGVEKGVIPVNFLYPATVVTAPPQSFERDIQTYCVNLDNVAGEHIIRPGFSPVQGRDIVVSAWMKMGGEDCNTAAVLT